MKWEVCNKIKITRDSAEEQSKSNSKNLNHHSVNVALLNCSLGYGTMAKASEYLYGYEMYFVTMCN